MVRSAREVLCQTAAARGTITYGDLAASAGHTKLPARSSALMRLLDEACGPLDSRYGIVTASLVVRADSGMPGEGYFEWAAMSGRDMTDPRAMWLAEVHRAWDALAPEQETKC